MDKCKFCHSENLGSHVRKAAWRPANMVPLVIIYCSDCGRDQNQPGAVTPPPCVTIENPED